MTRYTSTANSDNDDLTTRDNSLKSVPIAPTGINRKRQLPQLPSNKADFLKNKSELNFLISNYLI